MFCDEIMLSHTVQVLSVEFKILKIRQFASKFVVSHIQSTESVNLVCSFCQQDFPELLDLVSQAGLAPQDSLEVRAFLEILVQRGRLVALAVLELLVFPVHVIHQLIRFSCLIYLVLCRLTYLLTKRGAKSEIFNFIVCNVYAC